MENSNETQIILKLQARKKELKDKVNKLQIFAKEKLVTVDILERRIKRKTDLANIKEEVIQHLLRKQRKLLNSLHQLEEEKANIESENRSLRRSRCCHRNEC